MKFPGFFLLFIFFCLATDAAVFTVSTNLNAGQGSLRQAILDANANGTASQDFIHFDLPGTDAADMIINLTEELPPLTSNIVIDGTTQSSALFGNPSIKIRLVRAATPFFSGLVLDGVSNIEIYGTYFSNFISQPSAPSDERKAGIFLRNASHIKIGAPDRQNGFGNNYTSIISPTLPNLQEDITISSNIIGLDPSGRTAAGNVVGIDLSYVRNSVIGGPTAAYGNLISSNTNGVSLGALSGTLSFSFNVIGFSTDMSRTFPADQATGILASGQDVDLSITDNFIASQYIGIKIDNVSNNYSVRRNVIGTGLNSEDYGNEKYGIELYNCGAGSIDGLNVIAYNEEAIKVDLSYPVSILGNSIYCNGQSIVFDRLPKPVTPSGIDFISSAGARGTYLPNSMIELFYDDECPDCQGKVWIATIPTNQDGSWSYSGTLNGGITSTGTNAEGATSSFSKPVLSDAARTITGTFCGSSKGSIRNVRISDASIYRWFNSADEEVGDQQDLTDVPAGTYYLVGSQPGSCAIRSPGYTIENTDIEYKARAVNITPASCDQENGAVTITAYETETPGIFEWTNEAGEIVSRAASPSGLAAGKYQLMAYGEQGCGNVVGQFEVTAAVKPLIDLSGLVRGTTCDGRFVSGTGAKVVGTTEPYQYKWMNEGGEVAADGQELRSVSPGKYYLQISDRYGCVQTSPLIDFSDIGKSALVVPNSISPNGDGRNDTWKIQGAGDYTDADFSVFNRYGERVFHSRGYAVEFDGKVKGEMLPAGVYYYVIDLKGSCPRLTGSLTIIK